MSELEDLRQRYAALTEKHAQLLQRTEDAEEALNALTRGEIDAVILPGAATPLLLHEAQQALRRSEHLLRAIFDGAADAILLADDRGTYVDANPAACALFGRPRDGLIGHSIAEFAAPGYDVDQAYDAFQKQGTRRGQLPFLRADGSRRVLDYSAVANVAPGMNLSILRDITDRIEVEEAVRRSEAQFRALIEKSAEIISLTTADGSTRYLTPSAWRLLGWSPEESESRTMHDQLVPEDRARIAGELDRLVKTGARDMAMEIRARHRDGSMRWIESTGTNLLDDPDVRAIVGNYRDITAHKLAEEALRKSRDQLEEAQALAHIGSWTSGIEPFDEIHWTRECCRIFGVPDGTTMTVAALFSRVHPDDRERLERANRQAIEHETPIDVEHRVVRPDGQLCWVHARASIERDRAGGVPRIVGIVQDITERRRAVEALQASEQRYRRIVENTSEGVWIYDAEGITTFMNGRMAEMLGYTVEEAIGQHIYAFIDGSDRAAALARVERRRQATAERSDFRLQRKDGTPLWASIQANPLLDAHGRVEAVLSLLTDVSAQRLAEEARSRLAAIVESSEDAILSVTLDGTLTSWNLGAEKLYGYAPSEVIGHSISVLIPPEHLDEERGLVERVARGEAIRQHDTTRRKKDGSVVEVAVTMSPLYDAGGTVVGVSKIVRDLTARRQAAAALRRTEEQLQQAQKMEAVGRLAGGIAHDFNNLLTVILSYAELSMGGLKEGDPLREDMGEIHEAGKRATVLTRQLLAFSRQQVLQPRVIDLNEIVTGMKSMLGRLLGEDVELTLAMASDIGRVLADPGQVEQVVMNLAVNARDAMPEGGKLTIETANVHLDTAYGGVAPGHYVVLSISDSGAGMDAETRARIFEPFFTTKEVGKGTGLGLATVFGIVKQSDGYVSVYSELGHGSTFKVYLPRTDRAAAAKGSEGRPLDVRGAETILLVEDEQQVCVAAHAILRRNGYRVLESANAGEAMLIAKDFPEKIDLLFTDVVMPRMSGRKLAEHFATERPEMKVLFASGYTDDAVVRHGVLQEGVAFLQKPFTPDALLRKVRDVLDAPEAEARQEVRAESGADAPDP